MTPTDDALTEAVAKAIDDAERAFWRTQPDLNYLYSGEADAIEYQRLIVSARAALTTIRQHDEQAALNCGHCTPNTDEIACGCTIKERDHE